MASEVPNPTEFQILLALAGQERHGYGIMQEIARQSGERIRVGPGTLYGAIRRMQAAGWITGTPAHAPVRGAKGRAAASDDADDARRTSYYRLTPAGRAAAGDAARRMADLVAVAAGHGLVKLKPSH